MTTSRRDSTEGRRAVKSEDVIRTKVTAETLTDEMIRALQREVRDSDRAMFCHCTMATEGSDEERRLARARIAAAINARGGK